MKAPHDTLIECLTAYFAMVDSTSCGLHGTHFCAFTHEERAFTQGVQMCLCSTSSSFSETCHSCLTWRTTYARIFLRGSALWRWRRHALCPFPPASRTFSDRHCTLNTWSAFNLCSRYLLLRGSFGATRFSFVWG